MIHDVDESLRAFIRRDGGLGSDVEVVFDAPTKDWASRRNSPTVDMYLYDVREDLRRRHAGESDVRGADGLVTQRRLPPRWFKLSYLVTAWTQRPEDEHRLLSVLLQCFLRRDALPRDLLAGSLADSNGSILYTCASPPPEDRALSDVWSALGGELKPSLDLVLIAPFDLNRDIAFGPPVDEALGVDIADLREPGTEESYRPRNGSTGGAPSAAEVAARQAADGEAPAKAPAKATAKAPSKVVAKRPGKG